MAADPKTQEWWSINRPLQRQLEPGEQWWATMPEIFHTE
jgi:L-rhamnose mutarotase